MKKVLATVATLAFCCFGSTVFAAHEATDVDRPVVFGNVEVYGKASLSIDAITTGGTGTADRRLTKVSSNSSRLGFKGSEGLSDTLRAIYQVEMGVPMDSSGPLSLRNTYVGLKCEKGGTLLLGIHDTPYKVATGKLDIFSDTVADFNAIVGNVNGSTVFDKRPGNIVIYSTPTWGGVHVNAGYFTTDAGEKDNGRDTKSAQALSASAIYSAGPLFASVAYEEHKYGINPSDLVKKNTGAKAGLGYALAGTKIGLIYEALKDDNADSPFTRNAIYASLTQKIGKETLKVAYGMAEDGKSADKTGASWVAAGIEHSFSSRTAVYVLYAATKNDEKATYGLGNGQGSAFIPGKGEDPSVVGAGIMFNF